MIPRVEPARLLFGVLERPGEHPGEIFSSLPGIPGITAAVIDALPGQEDT